MSRESGVQAEAAMPAHGTYTRSLTAGASFTGHAELTITGELNRDYRAVLPGILHLVPGEQPRRLTGSMQRVRGADNASPRMMADTVHWLPGGRPPATVHGSEFVRDLLQATGPDLALPGEGTSTASPAGHGPGLSMPRPQANGPAHGQQPRREPRTWR